MTEYDLYLASILFWGACRYTMCWWALKLIERKRRKPMGWLLAILIFGLLPLFILGGVRVRHQWEQTRDLMA